MKLNNKSILIVFLELLALGVAAYLIVLPLYPEFEYRVRYQPKEKELELKNLASVKAQTEQALEQLPKTIQWPNRLIISKIGVDAPIIETNDQDYGLNKGAWLLPNTSLPDQEGNTVITGHRFKYLPPSNLTFYLLDKLVLDDIISVFWENEYYYYRVNQVKIIEPTDLSILEATSEPTLTLFTCEPIFSDEQRLVIVSQLIEDNS